MYTRLFEAQAAKQNRLEEFLRNQNRTDSEIIEKLNLTMDKTPEEINVAIRSFRSARNKINGLIYFEDRTKNTVHRKLATELLVEVINSANSLEELREIRNCLNEFERDIPFYSRTKSTIFDKPVSNHWKATLNLLREREEKFQRNMNKAKHGLK